MSNIKVLMVTSEWPTSEHPNWVPFVVQQVNYLRAANIDVEVFSFRGSKKPVNYLKAWLKVRKTLKSKQYDLIHAHFGQSGIIALPKGIPLVVTFHGSDLQGVVAENGSYTISGKILQTLSQLVALLADEIILVSPELVKMISRKKSYHIIPCGLDLSLFIPMEQKLARQKLGFGLEKKLILFGGRPEMPVKRYDLAIQVMSLIEDENVELVAINNIPHNQMPLYLNACNVLLLTSLHEGSPTIVKEALACNLPVVSTDVGDVRGRIESIKGCVLCSDDKPEAIASALKQVLTKDMLIDGRNTVLDLDDNLLVKEIINVYDKVMRK